jgi:hypothetical protein
LISTIQNSGTTNCSSDEEKRSSGVSKAITNIKDSRLENELVIGRYSYLAITGGYIPDCSELRLYNPSYRQVSDIRYEKLRFSPHFLFEMLKNFTLGF